MIKSLLTIIGIFSSSVVVVSAQNTFPWPSSSPIGIGTTVLAPNAKLTLLGGGINIGNSDPADASLHVREPYGGFNRLTQLHTTALNSHALNLLGSTNATTQQWWAWGALSSGSWAIQPGTNFSGHKGFFITREGNVGIGITTPEERLAINGNIRAKEVKVESDPATWPDYVFKSGYQLVSLKQTEDFVRKNGHLPGIPPAATVAKEGIALGEMNRKLLEKIEELTLYMIDLKKEMETLKNQKK